MSAQHIALVQGQRYRAQPTPHNASTCAGCAANDPRLHTADRKALCRALPDCYAGDRSDGSNVVWLVAHGEGRA